MFRNKNKVIGITGGKGGTGKSTMSVAIACQLSKEGKKVLLVDADVDCPNDHILLDIKRYLEKVVEQRIPQWDFEKCTKCGLCGDVCNSSAIISIKDRRPIFSKQQCNGCGACKLKCPSQAIRWDKKEIGRIYNGRKNKIDLLSGELKVGEPVSEFIVNSLVELIKEEKDKYDFVIMDTAAGIHCPVVVALENCDKVIAVTEPTTLGAHDLGLILALVEKIKVDTDIIINRFDIGDIELVESVASKYQAKIIANIPYSKDIFLSYTKGLPIENDEIKRLTKMICE